MIENRPWFEVWFESPWYEKIYDHRDEDEARKAIDLLIKNTSLAEGAKILDLCCGFGRHSASLAHRGFEVTGIDGSEYLISQAKKNFSSAHTEFFVCDMRENFPNAPFDCIVNMFTSFGYFDERSEDEKVLIRVCEALRSGGYFFMDFLNAGRVKKNLVPETVTNEDGAKVTQRRWIENNFVRKEIIIRENDSEIKFEEKVHLYTAQHLREMFAEADISVVECFGNYDGSKLTPESPRCILLGKKL